MVFLSTDSFSDFFFKFQIMNSKEQKEQKPYMYFPLSCFGLSTLLLRAKGLLDPRCNLSVFTFSYTLQPLGFNLLLGLTDDTETAQHQLSLKIALK